MAQLLVSHNFESRLRSHMKLHVRQFKYAFSWHIYFKLDLTKNMEMPNVLKKDVLKFNIMHQLMLNNYRTCLMWCLNCFTDKLQTHFLSGNA